MQPRNLSQRHGLIGTVPLAFLLAACGTTAATTTHSSSPTPTPTETPALVPTPSPTPVPTPAPVPPLALFYTDLGGMEVVNAQGVEQWGLTNPQEGQLFGLTAKQASNYNLGPQSGNSNLFFFYQPTPTSTTVVVVLSRTGKLLGRGTAPALDNAASFENSPTGTSWAWTIDQTPNAAGQHHGIVEVGGLGQANRIVYRWVAPSGFTEQLDGWTNTGIILQRTPVGGPFPCGGYDNSGYGWFAINPTTGSLTNLVSGNEQLMLTLGGGGGTAGSGVIVASLLNDVHSVLINGVKYAESKSIVAEANISPDGAHVAVDRESFNPCGGGNIPSSSIELVTLANQSHVDLPNLQLASWWDDNEIVASGGGGLWIYTLQGKPVSQIVPDNTQWLYQGALS
jgi:hypothetical protein